MLQCSVLTYNFRCQRHAQNRQTMSGHELVCPACGSEFERTYYQRRAADEPPDEVIFCPSCPLDTTRLSLDTLCTPSATDKQRSVVARHSRNLSIENSSIIQRAVLQKELYVLEVTGSAAERCWNSLSNSEAVVSCTYYDMPVYTPKGGQVLKMYSGSASKPTGYFTLSTTTVAPLAKLLHAEEYVSAQQTRGDYVLMAGGHEIAMPQIAHVRVGLVRRGVPPSRCMMWLALDCVSKDIDVVCSAVVNTVMEAYGTERSIKSFMPATFVSSLYVRSCKAYDWAHAPDTGFLYSWKPDGERYWLVRYGRVWLFVKRLLSGMVAGWLTPGLTANSTTIGAVLDVEVLMYHPSILLDVLALDDGSITSAVRSLHYVLESFRNMDSKNLPVSVKTYYRTVSELTSADPNPLYPTDGIVGVEDGTTDIIKIKSIKSIELRLGAGGELTSEDGKVIATSNYNTVYSAGSIIEIRVERDGSSGDISIVDAVLRTDKVKANTSGVCGEIVRTMGEMPDSLARRRAVAWCNDVRRKLHRIASRSTGGGRVILDIGAGDGQAISDYIADSGASYILLEPDRVKCESMVRRLAQRSSSGCRLFDDSSQLSHIIKLVSKGSLAYAVVCDTLEGLLSREDAIRQLKNCVRYCIASYSISHTREALIKLALSGLNIIGCGYLYDDTGINEYLINVSGVVMKSLGNGSAAVQWGSDRKYYESRIVSSDFSNVFFILDATNLVSIPSGDTCQLLQAVSCALKVISTSKHV